MFIPWRKQRLFIAGAKEEDHGKKERLVEDSFMGSNCAGYRLSYLCDLCLLY